MKTISQLWSILSPAEKTSAIGLVALMFVAMILEMLGIGIVVPALTVMSGDRLAHPSPRMQRWLDWLGNPSQNQLILGGLGLFLGLYAFKAAFLLFANWRQLKFVSKLQADLARRLFAIYLAQPWAFHLQHNSTALLRNIEDTNLMASTFTALLGTAAEMLILLGVLALLVWFEPTGAIAVGLLMVFATWLLERVSRRRLVRWGEQHQHHAGASKKSAIQGLNGAKEIKLLGRERSFIEQFAMHRLALVRSQMKHTFMSHIPRLFYELLAVAGLCILTAVMVWQGKATQAMIPTLGLFAAAAFRILPSVNRLAHALQSLRFSTSAIDKIQSELTLERPLAAADERAALPFRGVVALENVSYRYPKGHLNVVDGINLSIPHGSSIGLVGGSGAGKSTLVDIILGLLPPAAGRVTVDGVDISTNIRGWQNLVGYVPQTIYLCDDTLRRNVAFGVPDDKIDDAAVARALRAAQLEAFVAEQPEGVQTVVGERGVRLSGGQRQRIGIARALYHDPQMLVLDEATSALDNETEQGVMRSVEALQGAKTLLIVAHRLSTVAKCDRLYRLENGRIVQSGTFAEVVGDLQALQAGHKVAVPAP